MLLSANLAMSYQLYGFLVLSFPFRLSLRCSVPVPISRVPLCTHRASNFIDPTYLQRITQQVSYLVGWQSYPLSGH
jgi:hypothetical protein